MCERNLVDATITCGHAFGGDFEAVSVYSALAVARARRARRRRGRRDGPGHRRHQHPPRLQRHGGRHHPRRRLRARRGGDRVPARVVRRRAAAPLRAVAPHGHRAAPRHPRARAGGGPRAPRRRAGRTPGRGSPRRGHRPPARAGRPSTRPTRSSCSPAITCGCSRWGARPRTTPRCSRPPPPPARWRRSMSMADGSMADRLERLLNLTATLLDTRRPLTLDELAERVEPRYPEDKTRVPPAIRTRQGDAARARGADHGRDRSTASAPTRRTASTRRSTTCRSCRSPTPSSPPSTSRSPRCGSKAGRVVKGSPSSAAWRGRASTRPWPKSR